MILAGFRITVNGLVHLPYFLPQDSVAAVRTVTLVLTTDTEKTWSGFEKSKVVQNNSEFVPHILSPKVTHLFCSRTAILLMPRQGIVV